MPLLRKTTTLGAVLAIMAVLWGTASTETTLADNNPSHAHRFGAVHIASASRHSLPAGLSARVQKPTHQGLDYGQPEGHGTYIKSHASSQVTLSVRTSHRHRHHHHPKYRHPWAHWCVKHHKCVKTHPWARCISHRSPGVSYTACVQSHWAHFCRKHKKCLSKHPELRHARKAGGAWETDYITGYCDVGYTANGDYTHVGSAAGGPDIPFGTQYYIPEIGRTVTIDDRGGAVGDGHIDVWVSSCGDAYPITGSYRVERLN